MLVFRPHHFFCTLGFIGKGYSADFISNFWTIKNQLKKDELTKIKVVKKLDNICSFCPNALKKTCVKEEKIKKLDNAHKLELGLEIGDVLSWKEALTKMSKVSVKSLHEMCEDCSWRELGVCQSSLEKLKSLFYTQF